MGNINYQFLLSLIIIALGYISKRSGLLDEKSGTVIAKIIFNFTLPALIITTFSTMEIKFSLLLLPVINLAYGFIMTAVALIAFRKEQRYLKGMLSMALPGFNIGLFAYPLIEALLGKNGLKYIAMFDIGNAFILFVVCYLLAGYYSTSSVHADYKGILISLCKSIPLLSYIITFIISLSGLHYPGIILDLSKIMSNANMPLALFLLGVTLSFSFEKSQWFKMARVLILRYSFGLSIGLLLYFLLPFDGLFRLVLLIGFVLPIGMSVLPFAVQFNYDRKFVSTMSNINNIISFIFIWVILLIFKNV